MTESLLKRGKKMGEGSYGTVYQAMDPSTRKELAVKRNITDRDISFVSSVSELDLLVRFVDHPSMVQLRSISIDNPFNTPMSPLKDRKLRDDRMHFVFDQAKCNLYEYVNVSRPLPVILQGLVDVLLGLEFMHAKNILHRDLKPQNILIFETSRETKFKICDFGMGKPWLKFEAQTPRIITCWYRAPEVILDPSRISPAVDMWSLGCIIMEIFMGRALLEGVPDDETSLCDALAELFPNIYDAYPCPNTRYSRGDMSRYRNEGRGSRIVEPRRASSYVTMKRVAKPENTCDYWIRKNSEVFLDADSKHFTELCRGLLDLNPDSRWTATKALSSHLFDDMRDKIEEVRRKFPPQPDPVPVIHLTKCVERKWAHRILLRILGNKDSYSWFSYRILFQALDLFDRYLEVEYPKCPSNAVESVDCGRLHSYHEVEIRTLSCLYLAMKYFSTLVNIIPFTDLLEHKLRTDANIRDAENFEDYLITDICKYRIYRDTVMELVGTPVSEYGLRDLFVVYGSCTEFDTYQGWNNVPATTFVNMFLTMRRTLNRVVGENKHCETYK